jgi:cytoskeleton protein RodZ
VTRPEAEIAELPTDPGARLRRQRELAGLGEQQVAERLNLDPGVVAALECDDYAALGAPVFVRGHLRRYASLLGLASEEILGAYDRSRAQLAQPTLVPKSRDEMVPVRRNFLSPWLVIASLAFFAGAGVAAYLGTYGLHLPGARDARGRDSVTGSGDAGARRSSVATDSAAQVSAAAQGAAAEAVPPGQVALAFDFAQDSWIEVYDGSGRTVLYDLGKAGTRRAVSGVAPLSVTLGNAPSVALSVNGRRVAMPMPPPGQTVARFGVGSDGSTR